MVSEARGAAERALHPRSRQSPPADDITLAHKVETEIFRPADAPKGTVNVNAVDGVVFLRGVAPSPEQIAELETKIEELRYVQNESAVDISDEIDLTADGSRYQSDRERDLALAARNGIDAEVTRGTAAGPSLVACGEHHL